MFEERGQAQPVPSHWPLTTSDQSPLFPQEPLATNQHHKQHEEAPGIRGGLPQLLNALSIRHVGARVAAILASHFGSLEKMQQASCEEIAEINELFTIPTFSLNEKESYFSLNSDTKHIMDARLTLSSKVHFVLQIGYFKATSQFFTCSFKIYN